MKVDPLGDAAFVLRDLDAPAWQVANWLNAKRPTGVVEAVASYETVGVFLSPDAELGVPDIEQLLQTFSAPQDPAVRYHRIPACYELGPDGPEVALSLGMTLDELATCHCSVDYTCYAIGFCPGFPYLGYLPDALQSVPRRSSPRTRVEPGMVGITGKQTGVYPLPRPGGWPLIARTPLALVDVADEYFPIQAGDQVRFYRIGEREFGDLEGERLT